MKPTTRDLLKDARRLIMAHGSTLTTNPLQLYTSVLPTIPHNTKIAKAYPAFATEPSLLRLGRDRDWPGHVSEWTNHTDEVYCVAFSADGTQSASCSWYKTARIWDTASGDCISILDHPQSISCVTFLPDGTRVVTRCGDRMVRIWDIASSSCTTVLEGHTEKVKSVAVSSDGMKIVSGSWDGTLRIWDVTSSDCITVLKSHIGGNPYFASPTQWVTSVAFSPDGTKVVSASDNVMKIWYLVGQECRTSLGGQTGAVTSVAFSVDGSRVISGSSDTTIRVWNATLGTASPS